ncbi:MAG: hypothetical protein ACREFB_00770 [Stellaceae bacterium]
MRTVCNSLLAGVAVIAVAGFSGGAYAQSPQAQQIHEMTIQLPGGGVEQIRYIGDAAPRVYVNTAPQARAAALPSLFGPDSAFAQFERISEQMDRQADALLRETAVLAAQPSLARLQVTDFANLPPDSQGYSFVSTMSGNGVCTQSMQATSTGNGPPRVVTHTSGNCGPTGGTSGTIALPPAMAPQHRAHEIMTRSHPVQTRRPDVIMTRAEGARPYAGLVRNIPVSGSQR